MTSQSPATNQPTTTPWTARAWQLLYDENPTGFAILDRELRHVAVNAALAATNGIPPEAHVGRTLREVLPDLPDANVREFTRVVETGQPRVGWELTRVVADTPDQLRHWSITIHPVLDDDGTVAGLAVLVKEITDLRRAEHETAARQAAEVDTHRLRLLRRLTAALAASATARHIAQAAVDLAGETFGATTAAIDAIDDEGLCQILAVAGEPDSHDAGWQKPFPIDERPVLADLIRSGGPPVWWSSRSDLDRRYPTLPTGLFPNAEAGVLAPMRVDGRALGCIYLGWNQPRSISTGDIELITTVAAQTAAAMQRARLVETERHARRRAEHAQHRLALLGEVSAQLAAAGEETRQLTCLARLLLDSGFADTASVYMPDATGTLRRRIVVTADPHLTAIVNTLIDTPVADDDPRIAAWYTGQPAIANNPPLGRYTEATGLDPATIAELQQRLGNASTIGAPLDARGRRLGLFVVWRFYGRAPFDDDDLQLVTDVGNRAGTAIDNLRLLATQTRIATRLQNTLLPNALPTIDGIALAARYLPAERDADIGGDFYDIFAIDDSYALVIGDVAGRGIDAAGLTGIARTALRALADHLPPAEVLARLNALLTERPGDVRFLTLAFLLLHPHPGGTTIHTWLAGHPAPRLVRPDGTVTNLGIRGDLLGVLDTVSHHQHTYEATDGDLLVLYTDGLTEARGPDGLYGPAHLPTVLAHLAGASATTAVDHLAEAVTNYRDARSDDDTVILAARLTRAAEPDPGGHDR